MEEMGRNISAAGSERGTALDPSPGTPAAISVHGTAQGRAWGWDICTAVKCGSGGPMGRVGMGTAAS